MSEERAAFHTFLDQWHAENRQTLSANWRQYFDLSYPQWASSADWKVWGRIQTGGTYQLLAFVWYHHWHKPGSKEYRPSRIIDAVLEQEKVTA